MSVLVGKTFDPATFDPSTSGFSQCGGEYDRVRTRTLFHIHCYQTLVGRYVVLQAEGMSTQLSICEVEVYQEQGMTVVYNAGPIHNYKNLRVSFKLYCLY